MAGRTSAAWGADLVQGAARFADWRRGREVGARIPPALWELAVKLAERHGVSRTAQALPVGYYSLQERVAARRSTSVTSTAVEQAKSPTFVELPTAPFGAACDCSLEIEKPCGTVFVFRNRRSTAVKVLAYDGQGFWLCQKRLSTGRFGWWPDGASAQTLAAHELQVLLSASDPRGVNSPAAWRPIGAVK